MGSPAASETEGWSTNSPWVREQEADSGTLAAGPDPGRMFTKEQLDALITGFTVIRDQEPLDDVNDWANAVIQLLEDDASVQVATDSVRVGERTQAFSPRLRVSPLSAASFDGCRGILFQVAQEPAGRDARMPARILARDEQRVFERVFEVELR